MPKARTRTRKNPWCSRCNRSIHVPKDWSHGAATRRHYWSKHPEVMRGVKGARR